VFEKSGTFVNQQFRIQKFEKAVPGPAGVTDDLAALARLTSAVGGPSLGGDVRSVWAHIAAEVPALAGVGYDGIPDTGLLLDGAPWAGLAFAEGPGLHFRPANPPQKEAAGRG